MMTSEASSAVNLLETVPLVAASAATSCTRSVASSPSACSVISTDADRQSPFAFNASAMNSTASSPAPCVRQQPAAAAATAQFIAGASTSRSSQSLDSTRMDFVEQLAQNVQQYRRRRRSNSSDLSGSDDEGSGISHVSSIGGLSRCHDNDEDGEGVRKASTETPIRQADIPRGRLANIRRESSCTPSDEMAHERLTTAGIQVSSGFDDLLRIGGPEDAAPSSSNNSTAASPSSANKEDEMGILRRRAPSASASSGLSELSILTHAWHPQSCSPSPTRVSDSAKQCYSPSTQKIVRANIPYSPSPSPTASPTRKRLLTARSQSPIASRTTMKRRVDGLPSSPVGGPVLQLLQGAGVGLSPGALGAAAAVTPPEKRVCAGGAMSGYVRNCTSPLVTMDARAASSSAVAAAAAFRRSSLFLVDPELRRASADDVEPSSSSSGGGGGGGAVADSASEQGNVMEEAEHSSSSSSLAAPDADDALLFRAPSVPPLSVGSSCSSTRFEDAKSVVDGEEKMDEEDEELKDEGRTTTPRECAESADFSPKAEASHAMEE